MRLPVTFILLLSLLLAAPANAEERDYRETGITVVHTGATQPYYFVDSKGEFRGMLVELWELWSRKTGIPVHFETATWKDTMSLVLDGTYDIHAGLMISEEREKDFAYSQPLFTISAALVARKGEGSDVKALLSRETVAVVGGGLPEQIFAKKHPGVKIREYDSFRGAVQALANNEVGGVVMGLPNFHFNNIQLPNPVEYEVLDILSKNDIHAAVRKDNTKLLELIRKGFDSMDASERQVIQKRWFVMDTEPEPGGHTPWIIGAAVALALGLSISWLSRYVSPSSSDPDGK